ncbi:MAG: NADP-dependent oxidoreductase [Candidatus Velthaea sp.]
MRAREVRLTARPKAMPGKDCFALVDVDVPVPRDGEVRVRNTHMSVDPYMRGRMNEGRSYVPPFVVGAALEGGAVGVVEESRAPELPVETVVLSALGWRDYAVAPHRAFRPIDVTVAPPSAYLGVLGMPGLTAWVGLFAIGELTAGETVFISSAAGAVGSTAGQLAKRRGARVIGSSRSAESAAILRERLRFDETLVVEAGNFATQLRAAAPDGIDVYFDNVGGEQLEAALAVLRDFGRVIACGMIANYNEPVPGPRNIALVVPKRLRLQGFIVSDHTRRMPEFIADVAPALAAGELTGLETTVAGLERAPQALLSLFTPGAHVGKLIVTLP